MIESFNWYRSGPKWIAVPVPRRFSDSQADILNGGHSLFATVVCDNAIAHCQLVDLPKMPEDIALLIDVEKRTTRGRVCPRCGGKIIPSDRAVYQSTADPSAVFPIWQCERCGYEEMSEKPKPAGKGKH